tara:strand:+ start:642 stop:1220 length:579 start_codon:yes stop_codon:yes gene_type:complete
MAKRNRSFGTVFTVGDKNFMNKNSECDVLTFAPEDRTDILKRLKEINFGTEELAKNYENIDWFAFDCISVLLKKDEILGFSSVWHRPEYYKPGEARILNRYWEHPKLRMNGRIIARPHLVATVQHQIAYAKQAGYKEVFISRCRNPGFMKRLFIELGKKTNTEWRLHDGKQVVCDPKHESCWQHKGTYEIKD